MIYRELGNTGIRVSAVSMGCAGIGQDYPPGTKGVYDNAARDLLQAAVDRGINLFDTADGYCDSLMIVSRCVQPQPDFDMWNEFNDGSYRWVIRKSTRLNFRTHACKTGCFIHMIHNATVDQMEDQYAVSINTPEETQAALAAGVKIIQLPFNPLDTKHAFAFNRAGIIARSPLARGRLAHRAIDALRFSIFSGADTTLVGIKSLEELDMACEAVELGPLGGGPADAMRQGDSVAAALYPAVPEED